MSIIITPQWIAFPAKKSQLTVSDLSQFQVTLDDDNVELYGQIMMRGEIHVRFPRFCLSKLLATKRLSLPLTYMHSYEEIELAEFTSTLKLEAYQEYVVERLAEVLSAENAAKHKASVLLQLETGRGKTFVIAGLFHRLKSRMLYIVPTQLLQQQVADEMRKLFNCTVETPTGVLKQPLRADITVMVINSVCMNPIARYKYIGMVVYDEIQNYVGRERRPVFYLTKSRYNIGMSADIPEFDDSNTSSHYLYRWHFGSFLYEDDLDLERCGLKITNFEVVIKIIPFHNESPDLVKVKDTVNYLRTMNQVLALDKARNQIAVDVAKQVYPRKMMIFTHSKEHVHMLYEQFEDYNRVRFSSGVKKEEIASAYSEDTNVIISTYSFGSVGISISDATDLMVMMPPYETKYRQLVGRILRPNMANPSFNDTQRTIYVVHDSFFFARRHEDRFIRYCERRFGVS